MPPLPSLSFSISKTTADVAAKLCIHTPFSSPLFMPLTYYPDKGNFIESWFVGWKWRQSDVSDCHFPYKIVPRNRHKEHMSFILPRPKPRATICFRQKIQIKEGHQAISLSMFWGYGNWGKQSSANNLFKKKRFNPRSARSPTERAALGGGRGKYPPVISRTSSPSEVGDEASESS